MCLCAQGQFLEEVKRRVELKAVGGVTVSTKQDDFAVLHVPSEYDTVMELVFKTEFLTLLADKYRAATGGTLKVPSRPAPNPFTPSRPEGVLFFFFFDP